MITLGIIGVVAAMTIPALMTNIQKHQTVTRLKQSYALLIQAVKLSEAENGDIDGWNYQLGEPEFFNTYLLPYLKIAHTCDSEHNICFPNRLLTLNGGEWGIGTDREQGSGVMLMTGASLFFDNTGDYDIDINGSSGPNVYGKDTFRITICAAPHFSYRCPSKVAFHYFDEPIRESLFDSCSKDSDGFACGELIRRDGWKISKDYPW